MAHFYTLKSIHAHSQYISSFSTWICNNWKLFEIVTMSYVFVVELMVNLDVPNIYPFLSLYNQRSNGFK